jgi:molybdopterin molybdotransferase
MLQVHEALDAILESVQPLSLENLFLGDALGRVLASPLQSTRNLPPVDNSAMDGYGVRSPDVEEATRENPVALKMIGAIKAGDEVGKRKPLAPGEAVRIMTGATIPAGVDAVVMRENTDESEVSAEGTGKVEIHKAARSLENIRCRGEDVAAQKEVGAQGDILTPARINLLASAGHVVVPVYRKPVVAILASGDELKELGKPVTDDDIVNSNAYAIAAAVQACGGVPQMIGIAADTLADHQKRIEDASFADVLITIGGVSVGTHDFVRPALEAAGAALSFWKVAMRPGKPLAFGHRGEQVIFGLPGNPVSAQVSFEIFIRPALLRMMGHHRVHPETISAEVVGDPFRKRVGVTFFARAELTTGEDHFQVRLHPKQSSGQISAMAQGNALAVIRAETEILSPGERVDVLVLDPSRHFMGTTNRLS